MSSQAEALTNCRLIGAIRAVEGTGAEHRRAGYRYQLSILQAEFALTQILDSRGLSSRRSSARTSISDGRVRCGLDANRRLLCAQQLSHDCLIGEARFRSAAEPQRIDEQRVSGLPFGTPRLQALMQALCLFSVPPQGLRHRDLRRHVADLWGVATQQYGASQMTYDLRRLRLHGLIERIPSTRRYRLTDLGAATARFYTRLYGRALRPVLSFPPRADPNNRSRDPLTQLHRAIDRYLEEMRLAA